MFSALYYPPDEPRRWINAGGMRTMGVGLPAALGVKTVFPQEMGCVLPATVVFDLISRNCLPSAI